MGRLLWFVRLGRLTLRDSGPSPHLLARFSLRARMGGQARLTPHTPHITHRTSHVTRHPSPLTPHTSHASHPTHHTCWPPEGPRVSCSARMRPLDGSGSSGRMCAVPTMKTAQGPPGPSAGWPRAGSQPARQQSHFLAYLGIRGARLRKEHCRAHGRCDGHGREAGVEGRPWWKNGRGDTTPPRPAEEVGCHAQNPSQPPHPSVLRRIASSTSQQDAQEPHTAEPNIRLPALHRQRPKPGAHEPHTAGPDTRLPDLPSRTSAPGSSAGHAASEQGISSGCSANEATSSKVASSRTRRCERSEPSGSCGRQWRESRVAVSPRNVWTCDVL